MNITSHHDLRKPLRNPEAIERAFKFLKEIALSGQQIRALWISGLQGNFSQSAASLARTFRMRLETFLQEMKPQGAECNRLGEYLLTELSVKYFTTSGLTYQLDMVCGRAPTTAAPKK